MKIVACWYPYCSVGNICKTTGSFGTSDIQNFKGPVPYMQAKILDFELLNSVLRKNPCHLFCPFTQVLPLILRRQPVKRSTWRSRSSLRREFHVFVSGWPYFVPTTSYLGTNQYTTPKPRTSVFPGLTWLMVLRQRRLQSIILRPHRLGKKRYSRWLIAGYIQFWANFNFLGSTDSAKAGGGNMTQRMSLSSFSQLGCGNKPIIMPFRLEAGSKINILLAILRRHDLHEWYVLRYREFRIR